MSNNSRIWNKYLQEIRLLIKRAKLERRCCKDKEVKEEFKIITANLQEVLNKEKKRFTAPAEKEIIENSKKNRDKIIEAEMINIDHLLDKLNPSNEETAEYVNSVQAETDAVKMAAGRSMPSEDDWDSEKSEGISIESATDTQLAASMPGTVQKISHSQRHYNPFLIPVISTFLVGILILTGTYAGLQYLKANPQIITGEEIVPEKEQDKKERSWEPPEEQPKEAPSDKQPETPAKDQPETPKEESVVSPEAYSIPADAAEYNSHFYYLYDKPNIQSWEAADAFCKTLGGHLAVINSADKDLFLHNYIQEKGYDSAYFGLIDRNKNGHWEWADGSDVIYTNWAKGEPSSSDEQYGMYYYWMEDGTWNDGRWDDNCTAFLCEWDTVPDRNIKADEPAKEKAEESKLIQWTEAGTFIIDYSLFGKSLSEVESALGVDLPAPEDWKYFGQDLKWTYYDGFEKPSVIFMFQYGKCVMIYNDQKHLLTPALEEDIKQMYGELEDVYIPEGRCTFTAYMVEYSENNQYYLRMQYVSKDIAE